MEQILTTSGEAFGNKGSLIIALQQKGLAETYEPIEKEGGGWVGVPKKKEAEPLPVSKDKESSLGKMVKCRVYRSNVDPDNRDMPISVTVNSIANKKTFWPGEEVLLSEAHINVLKDSVEESRIHIPAESGIYASKDPVAVARNFYPSMKAEVDPVDNTISMVSRVPNFLVEISD
jgi:hypothetical protein